MRRTDEEFNAEVFRRSAQYNAQNRERKKKLLLAIIPAVCVIAAVLPSIYLMQKHMLPHKTAVASDFREDENLKDGNPSYADESNADEELSSGKSVSEKNDWQKGENESAAECPSESKSAGKNHADSAGDPKPDLGLKSWFLSVKGSAESVPYYRKSADPDQIRPIASAIDSLIARYDSAISSEHENTSGNPITYSYYITLICGAEAKSYLISDDGLFLEAEKRMIRMPSEAILKLKRLIDALPEN